MSVSICRTATLDPDAVNEFLKKAYQEKMNTGLQN